MHENDGMCTRKGARVGFVDFKWYLPWDRPISWAYIQEAMFITCSVGIYSIPIPYVKVDACFKFGTSRDMEAIAINIMQDGSLCAVGRNGYWATFQAPENWRDDMKKYADRIDNTDSATVSSKRASPNY